MVPWSFIRVVLMVCLALCSPVVACGQTDEEVPMLTVPRNASVTIIVRYEFHDQYLEGQGSGVIVADNLVLTCFHVAWGNPPGIISVRDAKGKVYPATLIAWSRNADLALIQTDVKDVGVKIASRTPPVGTDIWVVGTPIGMENIVSKGIISRANIKIGGEAANITLSDATILPGSSGGGAWTNDGTLVGLSLAITGHKNAPYAFTVLARAEEISKFLNKRPQDDKVAQTLPFSLKGIPGLGELFPVPEERQLRRYDEDDEE